MDHVAQQALASADIREVYKRLAEVWRRKRQPVSKEDEFNGKRGVSRML